MLPKLFSKHNIFALLTVLTMGSVTLPAAAASVYGPGNPRNGSASVMESVTESMLLPESWATSEYKKVCLTPDEIRKFNERNFACADTRMMDLSAQPETFDAVTLKSELASFQNPKNLYLNGQPVPASYYDAIRANIANIPVHSGNVSYGIAMNRTVMKSLPYADYLSDSKTDPDWDNLASSAVLVNEPLLVYFASADGQYYYVQSEICSGWIPAKDAAICHSKEEWLEAAAHQNFIVITGETVTLEASAANVSHSARYFDMGTVLELSSDVELVDNRMSWYNYVVWLPEIGPDGYYQRSKALVPISRDVHVGYLPLTQENIVTQAMKCLGNRYGWGGMLDSQDCSAFIREIYLCFGMKLPRNTTWQAAMPVNVISLADMSDADKRNLLATIPAGAILQFPGHEMLYLGAKNDAHYTINDVSSIALLEDAKPTTIRVRSVVLNSLEHTYRASGITWLTALNKIIIPMTLIP